MQTFLSGNTSKRRWIAQKRSSARLAEGTISVRLADRQRVFSAALVNPEAEIPPGLLGPNRLPSQKRFAVYRNNVVVGLIEALRTSFPATCRIVGEEFFWAMAREYVVLEPPSSP